VLTNHHIVLDGWSMPKLLQGIVRQLLRANGMPAAPPYQQVYRVAGQPGSSAPPPVAGLA